MDSVYDEKKMKSDMKEYELSFIIVPDASENVVFDVLKTAGADISYTRPVTHIRLGYAIKKHEVGLFGFCYFFADPSSILALSKELEMHKAVLRFLIVSPPVKPSGRGAYKPRTSRESVPPSPQAAPEERGSSGLSNEAIEQKIEEILK